MSKRPKKMDLNQLAKRIIDEATGEIEPEEEIEEKKKAAIESGRPSVVNDGFPNVEKKNREV